MEAPCRIYIYNFFSFFIAVCDILYHFGNFSVSAFFILFIMFRPILQKQRRSIFGLRCLKIMVWGQTSAISSLFVEGFLDFQLIKTKIDKKLPIIVGDQRGGVCHISWGTMPYGFSSSLNLIFYGLDSLFSYFWRLKKAPALFRPPSKPLFSNLY